MELNLIKIVLRFELLILSFNFMLNRTFGTMLNRMIPKLEKAHVNKNGNLWNHAKQNDTKTSVLFPLFDV